MRAFLEITIRETLFLSLAIGLDQTHLARKTLQRILQRRSDGLVLGKIQHYRRD